MKIAFSGPSGVGKTTLCKYVEEKHGLKHLSTSASDVLSPGLIGRLKAMGWNQSGHKDLIIHGHRDPEFAKIFQDSIL
jgi:predicted kinase